MATDLPRRKFLKVTGMAMALAPLAGMTASAAASTNPSLRDQFKYQNTPVDGKDCTACLEFIPGKTDSDLGGCKRIPGDDEIAPNGYCILWNTI